MLTWFAILPAHSMQQYYIDYRLFDSTFVWFASSASITGGCTAELIPIVGWIKALDVSTIV